MENKSNTSAFLTIRLLSVFSKTFEYPIRLDAKAKVVPIKTSWMLTVSVIDNSIKYNFSKFGFNRQLTPNKS